MIRFFFYLSFIMVIGVAIFSIQNSTAPPVVMKFLIWIFETSLIYTILGALVLGILIVLLFCIPIAIRSSTRTRDLKKKIEILENERKHHYEESKPKEG